MKRAPALIGLSRDHHHALVVARQLTRSGADGAQTARDRFVQFLTRHELEHFALEESVLLPALPDDRHASDLAARVREDHRYLREAMRRLSDPEAHVGVPLLHEIGSRLRAHVEMEEGQLFPYLESSLDPAALERLGARLAHPPPASG